jgi:hypothetical protein
MEIISAYYVKNKTYDDTPSQNVIILTTDTGVFGVPINTENKDTRMGSRRKHNYR